MSVEEGRMNLKYFGVDTFSAVLFLALFSILFFFFTV